ncbi:TPA: glucose-6-phosphate isomerase [Candidatus Micrarchaeota archaeon]|nr:glucose-6-phosphate isomerase [Candidatus Micrarchaeota archaeon]HIH30010.1 glucose-6-phosphate isomerase [Candidatus Micrarchaeota archaeon]
MLKFEKDTLLFNGREIPPDIRTFGEMRPVLAHPENEPRLEPDSPTYFMYRGVEKFQSIRYDITRILALDLSGELNKTFGHSHPKSKTGTAWLEVYEVLSGAAHFLIQRVNQLGVDDAAMISGKKGDCFLIPPGYGHVTINPGKTDLVLANLVFEGFESDYSMFAQKRGACYYELANGKIVKNPAYGTGFELRKGTAAQFSSSFGSFKPFSKKSLLEVAKNWEDIEFLQYPEHFY